MTRVAGLLGGATPVTAWRLTNASAALLMLLAGCAGRPLMPTPDLYAAGHRKPFQTLAPEHKSNQINLLFATDRVLEEGEDGRPHYGYQRSRSLAFGEAVVEIGDDVSWERLATYSQSPDRSEPLHLELTGVTELGRFPPSPYELDYDPSAGFKVAAEVSGALDQAAMALRAEVLRRLALTPRKELFLFVHGFNNSFADAAFDQAELWHFLGREGVPMIYTWPAGGGGALTGYAYDRESGEYTLFHLKELMRALAKIPEIEGIHILAHSRGTDIITSALRELFIEATASGEDPLRHFRIRNLVLAAPDIDVDVMTQRIIAERLGLGIGRVTIYTSIGDKAISASEFLFDSKQRLGRVTWDNVPDEVRDKARQDILEVDRVDFVEHKGKAAFIGHGYFHTNPSASSDLILIMRYGAKPGSKDRPLKRRTDHFWQLEDGYLGGAAKPTDKPHVH